MTWTDLFIILYSNRTAILEKFGTQRRLTLKILKNIPSSFWVVKCLTLSASAVVSMDSSGHLCRITWPTKLVFSSKIEQLFNLTGTPVSWSSVNTCLKCDMWLLTFFRKTTISSRYTSIDCLYLMIIWLLSLVDMSPVRFSSRDTLTETGRARGDPWTPFPICCIHQF